MVRAKNNNVHGHTTTRVPGVPRGCLAPSREIAGPHGSFRAKNIVTRIEYVHRTKKSSCGSVLEYKQSIILLI